MKTLLYLIAFSLAFGGVTLSQTRPTDPDVVPARSIKLTAEQGHTIKELIKDMKPAPASITENDAIKIGGKLPANVQLSDFSDEIKERVPAVRTHKFFMMGERVVIVHPNDNLVADIL